MVENPCLVPAIPPDIVGDKRWMSVHERYVNEARCMEPDVVFMGDSIIQYMQWSDTWARLEKMHCLNFGIGGDKVEHVLWRMLHGELDFAYPPRVLVLHVGTNNTAACREDQVAEGVANLARVAANALPRSHVLVLSLLPRGFSENPLRGRNAAVNSQLEQLLGKGREPRISLLRIDGNIVQADGTISHHLLHDYLHLTATGYAKIFEPVIAELSKLLQPPTMPID